MKKTKSIKVISIVLAICLLLSATLYIVFRKEVREDEILRAAIGFSGSPYMVLYENGDFIVERGISKHGDISKKPYITQKKIKLQGQTRDIYSRAEIKLEAADLERIKELAKNLDYVADEGDHYIDDAVPAKFYYNGRKINCSNFRKSRFTEELVEELVKLSPIGVSLSGGA